MPEAADLLFDISRMVGRGAAKGVTGIDRVQMRYTDYALDRPGNTLFLSRIFAGFALLDRDGLRRYLRFLGGQEPWPKRDLLSRLTRRQNHELKQSQTAIRKLAIATVPSAKLATMLRARLAPGFTYLNVGHSNIAGDTLDAIRAGGAAQIAAMVHDLIPVEYPEFTRPGVSEAFGAKIHALATKADLMICNSADTRARLRRYLAGGPVRATDIVIPLGVDPIAAQPPVQPPTHPYFVVLGTIEPRKNHLLLLNIWRDLYRASPTATPHLHIVGRRGWQNQNVFDVLDSAPFMGVSVFERGIMPDDALWTLLSDANALLFPSFAEGFGYPLVEAMQLGCPVICADLPALREAGGEVPTYLDPTDGLAWSAAIQRFAEKSNQNKKTMSLTWETHFALVSSYIRTKESSTHY